MEEKWINNLRNKMESHEESEPSGLWDDIEVALNEKKPSPIINRRKVLLWTAAMGAVAAMLTLIFLLGRGDATLITIPANVESTIAEHNIQESTTNTTVNKVVKEKEEKEKKTLLAVNTPSSSKQQVSNHNEQAFVPLSDKDDVLEKVEDENGEAYQKDEEKDLDNKQSTPSKKEYFPKEKTDFESINNYNYRKTPTNSGKLIASLYSTNLPNTLGESSGYGELIERTTLPKKMSASSVEEQSFAGDIIFANIGEETHTKIEHRQPIKAGLSLCYQLTNQFGVETGITYTYLSSNLTSGSHKSLYETEQSLQYIGIPLNVNYIIWNNKQLSFYVSTGGLVEKCIAGKSHTDYIIDNKIVESDHSKIKESSLQFSVNSSVGLQYNMTSLLGVFAEPGLAYYFDNGSSIETIYKEKPFNLNFKIGIRVNLN